MTVKKLFVLVLGVIFLFGGVGLVDAAQHEMKKEEKKMEAKPAAAKAKSAEGMVKSVSGTSLVVEGKDKKEWTFAISGTVAESAKKLKAGDAVKVSYTEADGKMMASKVTMAKMEKKAEKKAANPCAAKNPCAPKK